MPLVSSSDKQDDFLKLLKWERKKKEKKEKKREKESARPDTEETQSKRRRRLQHPDDRSNDYESNDAVRQKEKEKGASSSRNSSSTIKRERRENNNLEPGKKEENLLERKNEIHNKQAKITNHKQHAETATATTIVGDGRSRSKAKINFPVQYILAPMVGASELAFRLLCRKYGAQLAYTPMMSARQFAQDEEYRNCEFQTTYGSNLDRPLVCHFAANQVDDFVAAAKQAEPFCDAIDLNLGCPQRTAYLGHFGSYLLDPVDRKLICDMIRAGVAAVRIPIFCKIRLLDTIEETIKLCRQLAHAGASLIAIHARYRASWERKGPGARDGAALLDQVAMIQQELGNDVVIVTNGNTITWNDVQANLQLTGAPGLMSAEGLLDNPALFLPRYGSAEHDRDKLIAVPTVKKSNENMNLPATSAGTPQEDDKPTNDAMEKEEKKLLKKLEKIKSMQEQSATPKSGKSSNGNSTSSGENDSQRLQRKKLKIMTKLQTLQERKEQQSLLSSKTEKGAGNENGDTDDTPTTSTSITMVPLGSLYDAAQDKLQVAYEYLDLVDVYPVKLRSVIFHIRRMIKDLLVQYQLLEECLNSENVISVRNILDKIAKYRTHPETFVYDVQKAKQEKDALERKKREEGKRKAYEERMIRKAKREGKTDLHYYLHIGAKLPSTEQMAHYRTLSRQEVMEVWKQHHSQHCLSFHLDAGGCSRGRACAFLHTDMINGSSNNFVEKDEVAG